MLCFYNASKTHLRENYLFSFCHFYHKKKKALGNVALVGRKCCCLLNIVRTILKWVAYIEYFSLLAKKLRT